MKKDQLIQSVIILSNGNESFGYGSEDHEGRQCMFSERYYWEHQKVGVYSDNSETFYPSKDFKAVECLTFARKYIKDWMEQKQEEIIEQIMLGGETFDMDFEYNFGIVETAFQYDKWYDKDNEKHIKDFFFTRAVIVLPTCTEIDILT